MNLKQFLKRSHIPESIASAVIRSFRGWDNFVDTVPEIPDTLRGVSEYLDLKERRDNGEYGPERQCANYGKFATHFADNHREKITDVLLRGEADEKVTTAFQIVVDLMEQDFRTEPDLDQVAIGYFAGDPRFRYGFKEMLSLKKCLTAYCFLRVVESFRTLSTGTAAGQYLAPEDDGFFEDPIEPDSPITEGPDSPDSEGEGFTLL